MECVNCDTAFQWHSADWQKQKFVLFLATSLTWAHGLIIIIIIIIIIM